MHGPHQMAQKSSNTILPLKLAGKSIAVPSVVFALKTVAGLPTARGSGRGAAFFSATAFVDFWMRNDSPPAVSPAIS